MGRSKKVTVGYWYHPVFQMVLGRGPVDAVLRVRGADVDAWLGALTASGTIAINNPELWGGENSEGGIVGNLQVSMGDAAQTLNAYAAAQLGADGSAHKGQLSMLFKGGRFGAMNPYPKPLSFMVRRILAGWEGAGGVCWYPGKAPIQVDLVDAADGGFAQDSVFKYSLVDGSFQSPAYNDSDWTEAQGPFGSGTHPNLPTPPNTVTPWPGLGDVLWLRKAFYLATADRVQISVWHDNTLQLWLNGALLTPTVTTTWTSTFNVTPLLGANLIAMRVEDASPLAPDLNFSYAGVAVARSAASYPLLAINPAHALYYSLVADSMQGEPAAYINDASFEAAADLFFAEGLGICTEWDSDNETVEQFRARICDAVGARMSRSTVNGQWYLDVQRGQYDLASLPILNDDDILDFEDEPALLDDAVNQVAVQWFDPLTKQERTTAPLHALGAIDAGVNAQTLSYTCLPTEALANRVALRELRQRATPLTRFKLVTNRKPYSWRTGTYFRLQAPKRGISDMVCLLGDIEKGTLRSGAISLTAVQDVFAMPATAYVEAQPPLAPPSSTPVPVLEQLAFEAPYVELVQRMSTADIAALSDDAGFLAVVGAQPGGSTNYQLNTRPGSGAYAAIGNFDWCPAALVVEAADRVDTAFTLDAASLLNRVEVGTAALWGDEIVRVDALDVDALTLTLGRGCADTVPQQHAAGERIWFYDAWSGADLVEYVDGETVDAKLLTRTGTTILPLGMAPAASATFDSRAVRPYPPAHVLVNGVEEPVSVSGALSVTWRHRDRGLQADQLVDQAEASIGPEATTTYSGFAYDDPTDTLLDSATGLSGTSWSPSVAGGWTLRIEVESERDTFPSWQRQTRVFNYASSALLRGEGDELLTAEGDLIQE